ncbi:hypothetical protein L484_024646 [Morus notabilis]|uniref:Uncharacterized protein n=1 Tax=Morus notabilis TaxID=981085 RepID=W9RDV4_9ROSA|nr:hypothetical protein L484_024646 [Morus notabilis]
MAALVPRLVTAQQKRCVRLQPTRSEEIRESEEKIGVSSRCDFGEFQIATAISAWKREKVQCRGELRQPERERGERYEQRGKRGVEKRDRGGGALATVEKGGGKRARRSNDMEER